MSSARQPAVPHIYGRYQTLFRIASGGMAEVYAARVLGEAGFQKLVALKRMLPHLTDDERFVTMFMDEGKLAAYIDSPNVVSTMDLGRADDGSLYLVMELVVGTTLSTLLRNAAKDGQNCPIDVACEIIAQAAQGLHDAHEAKTPFGAPLQLVHRDISPQNILVGVDGRVRITDFGVARAVLRRTKTSTGEFKGKLSYFSPEQVADKDLDRRSDLFSLGVVAWETLTTRRLFHAENPLAVLERVTRMEIPSAHTVASEVPTSVAAVVAKALERDRDERYSSAAEFGAALRAAARETVGVGDRHRVSEMVSRYGGDALERVQAKLRESLSAPDVAIDDDVPEPVEVSSGIIIRPEDAPTPRRSSDSGSDPIPRFQPPAIALDERPLPPARRAPMYVAIAVATLGLGGGAAIGLYAGGGGASAADPDPAIAGEPTSDPELDPTSIGGGTEIEEGDLDEGVTPTDRVQQAGADRAGAEPTDDPEESDPVAEQPPAGVGRRPSGRRGRADRLESAQRDARLAELERQQREREQRDRERQAREEREERATPPQGGTHGPILGIDSFNREVGGH
ncbi:MAG: serine/threonine protein kinase [Sandaracinaceae bacterium]